MSQAILQILLILAYLAIGLISLTFPIFALCVTYLRQEKSETEKELKKRRENLLKKIAELTDESDDAKDEPVSAIEERIANAKTELKGIELKVGFLTAKGAVLIPICILLTALFVAATDIWLYYENASLESILIMLGISVAFMSWGV